MQPRKILLIPLFCALLIESTSAQWTGSSLSESTSRIGNVAIGKSNPDSIAQLHLWKDVSNGIGPVLLLENPQYSNSLGAGSLIRFQGYQEARYIDILTEMENNGKPRKLAIVFNVSGDTTEALTIRRPNTSNDVYVGIGDTEPSYPLVVNGITVASEVIVVADPADWHWPDYVFNKDYKLKPLDEVELFIKENHHLEGIPDINQVKEEGIKLKSLNTQLLKKVEELTLYIIEHNKEIEYQSTLIEDLIQENRAYKKKVLELETKLGIY